MQNHEGASHLRVSIVSGPNWEGGVSEKKKRSRQAEQDGEGRGGREGGLSPGGERRELAEYR